MGRHAKGGGGFPWWIPPDDSPERSCLPRKETLVELAERLTSDDTVAIAMAVDFVVAESYGLWHGRARAKFCRRLKHCPLLRSQRERLVDCIAERLRTGCFSEQFRDQVRLARLLDPARIAETARACAKDTRPHVRRFGEWALRHRPVAEPRYCAS